MTTGYRVCRRVGLSLDAGWCSLGIRRGVIIAIARHELAHQEVSLFELLLLLSTLRLLNFLEFGNFL